MIGLTAAGMLTAAGGAAAQTPAPLTQAVVTDIMEPDFNVINLPTTRPMKPFRSSFHLTHRFLGNLKDGSFADNLGNLFGLDNGAMVGLEYRIALTERIQAVFYRSSIDKTIQFSGRFDAVRQSDVMPVSISAFGGVEGNQNFGWHAQGRATVKAPTIGATVSRTLMDRAVVYVVPAFTHNTLVLGDVHRNTFILGTGARVRLGENSFIVAEVSPRLSGYAPGSPEFGFGIEKRVGGHTFQLNFSNATATTFAQVARGGFPSTIYFGFNLGRKF